MILIVLVEPLYTESDVSIVPPYIKVDVSSEPLLTEILCFPPSELATFSDIREAP